MATTTVEARFQSKIDTYDMWTSTNPILLKGEIGIATIPVDATTPEGIQSAPPILLFKVGDGTSTFNALDWISAKAADVYSWAKAATKPTYTADEISGLSDYISGNIQDTDTQYKLVKVDDYNYKLQSKSLNGSWADVADSTITIPEYDDSAVEANTTAIATLNGTGTGSVTQAIANAIAALNLSTTYEAIGAAATVQGNLDDYETSNDAALSAVATRVTTAEGTITTLVGSDTGKSVRAIASEELATQLIPEGASESLDSLVEIAAWIQAHPDDAAAMNAAITALQTQLVGIGSESGAVKTYVDAAITALSIGDYATAASLTTLAARVTTLEGATHTHDNKTVLDGITAAKVTAWDAAEQNAKDYTDVLEEELAAVAKSGDINDLIQNDGDYVIFNCGTSSTVI